MKTYLKLECPYCGKVVDSDMLTNPRTAMYKHMQKCKAKTDFINQFAGTKEKLEELLNELGSVSEFIRKYQNLAETKIGETLIREIFKDFKIDTSVKRANLNDATKNRRKETNLERYGCEHNFCKNSPSRKEGEARLLKEEGITNVFQRDSVKQKSKETLLRKYGVEHIAQCDDFKVTKDYCIKKYGLEEGTKEGERIRKERGKLSNYSGYVEKYSDAAPEKGQEHGLKNRSASGTPISGLNIMIEAYLKECNIEYESEFMLQLDVQHFRFYDFKIGNILIELNGTFGHADPRKYKSTDVLHFPGTSGILASDIWRKDALKKELATQNGYQVVYYWETELTNSETLLKIKKEILNYANSQNKINNKNSNDRSIRSNCELNS